MPIYLTLCLLTSNCNTPLAMNTGPHILVCKYHLIFHGKKPGVLVEVAGFSRRGLRQEKHMIILEHHACEC